MVLSHELRDLHLVCINGKMKAIMYKEILAKNLRVSACQLRLV